MLTIDLIGDKELIALLDAMPARVRSELVRTVPRLAAGLTGVIIAALSGRVLNVRTGALRSSIRAKLTNNKTEVSATIYTNSPYAAIHEYGGTIHVPEIRPKTARALAFQIGGQTIFAAFTRAHDVHMPERSFMRSSLQAMTPLIRSELTAAVDRGIDRGLQ